jgi:hypothetical protein
MHDITSAETCNPVRSYCNRYSSATVVTGVVIPTGAEVFVKIDVSWEVAASSPVESYRRFGSAD